MQSSVGLNEPLQALKAFKLNSSAPQHPHPAAPIAWAVEILTGSMGHSSKRGRRWPTCSALSCRHSAPQRPGFVSITDEVPFVINNTRRIRFAGPSPPARSASPSPALTLTSTYTLLIYPLPVHRRPHRPLPPAQAASTQTFPSIWPLTRSSSAHNWSLHPPRACPPKPWHPGAPKVS